MHFTPHWAAAALIGLASGATQAQVSLSGIVDLAARHVSNTGRASQNTMVSGANSTSRLVFRGSEDLGDGLAASFHLEHGFSADTGEPTATGFFERRATVSLSSKTLGELRAGRDFVPSHSNWSRFDPFSYVGAAGSNNLVSNTPAGPIRSAFGSASTANTTVRASKGLHYFLPAGLQGMEGSLMVSTHESSPAANGVYEVLGLRLGWAGGPAVVSAAYTRTSNDLTTTGSFTDTVVGGSYNFGVVRASLAHRKFKQNQASQTNTMLAAVVPVGASGEIKASWVQLNMAGRVGNTSIDANDSRLLGLGYVHNLSKRSALYATLSQISNQGAATFTVPGGPAAPTAGGTSKALELGLRHNF